MISNAGASGELYCPTCEQPYATGERCPHDGTKLVRLATTVDPFLGRELEGRYTIVEKLGQGGMGTVYRGHQHSVGRDVAIKVVTPALVSSPNVIKRFLRECKLASRLSHPNAVGVLDFGQTDDGTFFLVMEMVHGRTLDAVMEHERQLRPERVIRIGVQICDALEGAHGIDIIHRDLKPANVMLLNTGRDLVKVLDFGLAKSLSPDSARSTMTGEGALMGTPAYMPPELARGEECDGRADLYSLGCMLYYLGSGGLPFTSDSVHELVMMQASEPAPPMTGVPAALATVIDRLLLKDPDHRYPSAAITREALEHALARLYDSRPAVPGPRSGDTEISLGPFPASSSQFASLASEPGHARDGALAAAPPRVPGDLGHPARRRSRALVVGTVAAVLTVVGVAMVLGLGQVGRGGRSSSEVPTDQRARGVATDDAGLDSAAVPGPVGGAGTAGAGSAAATLPLDAGAGVEPGIGSSSAAPGRLPTSAGKPPRPRLPPGGRAPAPAGSGAGSTAGSGADPRSGEERPPF